MPIKIESFTYANQKLVKAFIEFPRRIYHADPNWVPPLREDMHVLLNPAKHPFHAHADVIYFLAFKGEHVAGRICAHVNHNHNAFHAEKTGFFGFFECLPDQAVADALLEAARQWLVDQGMERMRGPANFSTNEECALLVEGFDSPPVMMMPYNPPYYIELLEHYGLHKVMDLWAWYMTCEQKLPEKVVRIAEKIRQKEGITVRPLNMKDFGNEVKRIKDIYGSAWEKNWGFVPPTDAEIAHLANEFKPIVIPELALIAEVKGEAVAFSLTLPDGNQILKAANGKLYPFGIIKLLWAAKIQKKINQLRLLLLGIKEGYRKRGIDSILYVETFQNGTRLGYKGGEISWTLETNTLVNRAIELMGGRKYKTYRFYEKEI